MKLILKVLFIIISPCIFLACENGSQARLEKERHSFCYWDRNFAVDTSLWNKVGAEHLYVRYFDVDWDDVSGDAKPIASIQGGTSYGYGNVNDTLTECFTPSVFITNRVFEKASKQKLDSLSFRIIERIDQLTENFAYSAFYRRKAYNYWDSKKNSDSAKAVINKEFQNKYTEILIDCDWTEKTKENFFYFLNRIKKDASNKNISATLRLWQYKSKDIAGVPPVDRCLLMCYNMQTANDYNIKNSIATTDELKKYISGDKYPINLDIALPIFNWAVLFRNEEFMGVIGNVDINEYKNNILEYEDIGNNKYRLLEEKIIGNFFARKGDVIRIENISKEDLVEMADYLKANVTVDQYSRISFFSWNKTYINNYGIDEIKNIYTAFTR